MEVSARGRLIYIEPNNLSNFKGVHLNGNSQDNVVHNPEEFNYAVDLQVIVPDRTQCGGDLSNDGITFNIHNINKNGMISFFEGTTMVDKKVLTDNYTDASFNEMKNGRNKECLGITSIDIDFASYFYPQVTIQFTDVRAFSLMGNAEAKESREGVYNSFFQSVFHYPYPKFLLTVKGFFGTKVTFKLAVNEFTSRLNQQTGNFDVTITFIGYMYGLYTDIPTNYILIAPYINSDVVGATSSYWDNGKADGRFTYDNAIPMMTMVEFCDKYVRLAENLSRKNDILSNNSGIKEYNESHHKSEEANKLISLFNEFINSINFGESSQCKKLNNENLYLFYGDGDKVELNLDDKQQKLWDAILEFNKKYGTNFETLNGTKTVTVTAVTINEPLVVNGEINPKIESNPSYQKIVNETLVEGEGTRLQASIDENREALENAKWYLYDSNHFLSTFRKYKNDSDMKMEEVIGNAQSESLQIISSEIGFTPNLENIFRMIFAHIDCFMHSMYELMQNVKSENRTRESLDIDSGMSDVPASYDTVPPFPLITNDEDGKRVAIFPGEENKYANMREVAYVDSIIQATLAYRRLFNKVSDYLSKARINENTDAVFVQNFFPIMVSDVFYEGNNPYNFLNDNNDLTEILYFYLLRYRAAEFTHTFSKTTDAISIPEIEARNFFMSKDTCDEAFLQTLNGIKNEKETGFINAIQRYMDTNKNQVIDAVQITNNTIKNKNNDTYPLCFDNTISNKIGTLVKQRYPVNPIEGMLNSGFGIHESNWTSTLEGFKNIEKINEILPVAQQLPEDKDLKHLSNYVDLDYDKYYGLGSQVSSESRAFQYIGRLYLKPSGNDEIKYEKVSDKDYIDNYISILKSTPESVTFPFVEYQYGCNLFVGMDGFYGQKTLESQALMFLACMPFSTEQLDAARCALVGIKPRNLVKSSMDDNITGVDAESTVDANSHTFVSGFRSIPKFLVLYLGGLLYRKHYNKQNKEELIKGFSILNETDDVVSIRTCSRHFALDKDNNDGKAGNAEDNSSTYPGVKAFTAMDNEKKQVLMDYFKSWADNEFPILKEYLKNGAHKYIKKKIGDYTVWVLNDEPAESHLKTFYASYVHTYTNSTENLLNSEERSISLTENNIIEFCTILAELYQGKAEDIKNNEVKDSDISKETKLSIYLTLKKLYDKWLCATNGGKFTLNQFNVDVNERTSRFRGNGGSQTASTEFTNFIFTDSYGNDLSQRFMVNPKTFYELIRAHSDAESNTSVFQFISDLCLDNKLRLLSLPVYNNFYDAEMLQRVFSPNESYAIGGSVESKMADTYVVLYQHEASTMLEESNAEGILYGSNGFDIADSLGNPNAVSLDDVNRLFGEIDDNSLNINMPAFGVTVGRQSQSMFKSINVNMDGPRVTDYSIANTFELGKLGANGFAREPYSVGQDMFAIYSNRSYNCSVDMMGCANIMPMMYFQLNNVPMFKGAYIITDVKHKIVPGDMTTTFTGVRVCRNQIPFNTDVFNIKSFLAMIDGYVKNGGSYDKPIVKVGVSKTVAAQGDGSGVSNNGSASMGTINTSIATKLKGNVKGEYHLILQRYKKFSNGTLVGVIYEANTKKVLCHTIEDFKRVVVNSGKVGDGIHPITPGATGWVQSSKPWHRGASAYTAKIAGGKPVKYGTVRNGQTIGNTGTMRFGQSTGDASTMLRCDSWGGCLFHMGSNISWTEGCILIGDTVDDNGKRSDFSGQDYSISNIFTSSNRHVVAYRNFYDTVCGKLVNGQSVFIEIMDAYNQNEMPLIQASNNKG